MINESNIRRDKHYIFKLHMHWVFVAKSRRRRLYAREIDVLRSIFADVCSDAQATRVKMDGEDAHVQLPINIVRQYIEQQKIHG
jgi:putative transposase